jgi:hypothetical protein
MFALPLAARWIYRTERRDRTSERLRAMTPGPLIVKPLRGCGKCRVHYAAAVWSDRSALETPPLPFNDHREFRSPGSGASKTTIGKSGTEPVVKDETAPAAGVRPRWEWRETDVVDTGRRTREGRASQLEALLERSVLSAAGVFSEAGRRRKSRRADGIV